MKSRTTFHVILLSFLGVAAFIPFEGFQETDGLATQGREEEVIDSYASLPLGFEATEAEQRRFLARGSDYSVWVSPNEAVVVLSPAASEPEGERKAREVKTKALLRVELVGADADAGLGALVERPAKANYFLGADPRQWRVNIPTYETVGYRDVYPGVDVVFYGNQGCLEYDFIVAPGADPEAIRLRFGGVDGVELASNGDLLLRKEAGAVRQHKPVVYQRVHGARKEVSGGYRIGNDNRVSFEIGDYDESQPLVIDPVLSYSTYLGGSDRDLITGIQVDRFGHVYLLGQTRSVDFPTFDAVQEDNAGGLRDVTVMKLNREGTAVLFSTYLGGSDLDVSAGFDVDYWGNVYLAGDTRSSDFPLVRPMQASFGGIRDGFVAKLDASGSALHYSTYLGASDEDGATQLAIDFLGEVYVAGFTRSIDFPTRNALQSEHRGMADIFLAKLNRRGSALRFSTFLGGSGGESVFGMDRDIAGGIYLVGFTNSVDFPTTPGAFQTSFGGLGDDVFGDGFVVKLDRKASGVLYSTYLGGRDTERALSVEVDLLGRAYVAGNTNSPDFPITPGAFQPTFAGGDGDIVKGDAFVAKLNRRGSDLLYSTYLGGSADDGALGMVIDGFGRSYVTGFTASDDFPTTGNAVQPAFGGSGLCTAGGVTRGCRDAFVTILSKEGDALRFSTYLGGTGDDQGDSIALRQRTFPSFGTHRFLRRPVSLHVAGSTSSTDFPTENAYQSANAGDFDHFVVKLVRAPE